MQTFLPYRDFEASARALDAKRLGKQRVEVIQIVRALTRPGYGWASHPAVLMWQSHEEALGRYGLATCDVWLELGFGDTCAATIAEDLQAFGVTGIRTQAELEGAGALPTWLDDERVLRSHQSSLVRKDPEFYGPRFPGVPGDIEYFWPVRSPVVLERELRREENAIKRRQREADKAAKEHERARRRRSEAARRGWQTRVAKSNLEHPPR